MSPSGNNQNSADLRFNATLQDNVSPAADQIAKKMKELGATDTQIKIFVKAYDEASTKVKNVQEQVKKLPKEHHIHIKAHTEDAHKKIGELHKIAAAPVHVVVRMKDETEQTAAQVSNRIRNLKSELVNMVSTMPVLNMGIQGVQNVSQAGAGMAGQGLGIGGFGTGVAGVASAGAAMGLLQKSFAVNNEMQQQLVTLQSTLKDRTQAQAELQSNVSYALKTPFNLPDVQAADVQLRALGVPRTSPINIKAVGNMAAAVHRKPQDAAQALAEAYRGDFALLPGYGVTLHQSDFSAGGRFAGQSYERGVSQLVRQRFGGATQLQANTLSGSASNIQDVINQQIIGGAGRPVFSQAQRLVQGAEQKLTSVGFQQDIGPKIDKVQRGLAQVWETLQRGKQYFQTNLEQPLKDLVTTIMHVGKVFASTFGSVVLTGVKTLGEAFTAIIQPLGKLIQAHPLLVQMFAVMKGFQMLGMNKMASPFEGFFHSINPLSFSITGLIKSIGGLLLLAPKLAVIFTVKSILDMHSATEALTNSFDKFHQSGSKSLDGLQFKLDAMSGSMGKTAAEMKEFAAEIANLAPATMSPKARADFALSGAQNLALMDQQGYGKQAHSLFIQKLQSDDPAHLNPKSSDEAFREVTQSIRGVSSALGVDLKEATKLASDSLTIFAESLTTRGLNNVQGGGMAASLVGSLRGIPITGPQLRAGIHSPNELIKSILDRGAQPSSADIEMLNRQGVPLSSIVQFRGGPASQGGIGQLRQYSHQDQVLRSGLQKVDQRASELTGMNIHLPNAPSQFQANKIGVDFSKLATPQGQAQEWIRLSHVVDQVGKAYSATQQHSAALQDQQTRLSETQEIVNKRFQNFQYSLQLLSRPIEDLSLAMGRFQLSVLRPLERDMTRLQNTIAVYQHNSVVPIQRAQEDWNQVMVRTSNRIADVSFHLGKAQFEMGKFSEGLFTGEQKVLDNIHALERYNQQLNLLKLQNMGLQADLTKTTVDQGFSMVVKPLMGFSLEREIQLGQRRQEIAQANYDLKYGEMHYQVGKAARPLFQRQEMSFGQRMRGTEANIAIIDKETLANRHLENVQYQQSLTARKLQEQMYQASVGARKYEDATFALSQKIFKANEHMQNMQDKLSGLQLHLQDVSRGARPFEDAQHKLANASIDLNLALTETNRKLSQLQGNLEVARDTQGILGKMFFGNIKPGDLHAQVGQLLKFIEVLRNNHDITNAQADAMEAALKKFDNQAEKHAHRHVSIWKKAWDEISGDFVGIFTGSTFVKIFDLIKHGVQSLGLPNILGTALGLGGAGVAGLYAINAIRLLIFKHLVPGLVQGIGASVGALISKLPGEGATKVGGAIEGGSSWFARLIGRSQPNTLLRPWNWLRGFGGDIAGSAVATAVTGNPALGVTLGKAYGYGVEASRSPGWRGPVIPGPIDASRGVINALLHPLETLKNVFNKTSDTVSNLNPNIDNARKNVKTFGDNVRSSDRTLSDVWRSVKAKVADFGVKLGDIPLKRVSDEVSNLGDKVKVAATNTETINKVTEPAVKAAKAADVTGKAGTAAATAGKGAMTLEEMLKFRKVMGPLGAIFDTVLATGALGHDAQKQGQGGLLGTGLGGILGAVLGGKRGALLGAGIGGLGGSAFASNDPIQALVTTAGAIAAQKYILSFGAKAIGGIRGLFKSKVTPTLVEESVAGNVAAGEAGAAANVEASAGANFLAKSKIAFGKFFAWQKSASAVAGAEAGAANAAAMTEAEMAGGAGKAGGLLGRMKGRIGPGLALGFGGNLVGSMVGGPVGHTISGAATGAGIGMLLGPEGAVIGGLIGGLLSLPKELTPAEKALNNFKTSMKGVDTVVKAGDWRQLGVMADRAREIARYDPKAADGLNKMAKALDRQAAAIKHANALANEKLFINIFGAALAHAHKVTPQLLVEMHKAIAQLPPDMQRQAIRSMKALAKGLRDNHQLPESEYRKFIKAMNKEGHGLTKAAKKEVHNMITTIVDMLTAAMPAVASIAKTFYDLLKPKGMSTHDFFIGLGKISKVTDPYKSFQIQHQYQTPNTGPARPAGHHLALPHYHQPSRFEPPIQGIPHHAGGLDRVPYDNYLALLHQDETVLPAAQSHALRAKKQPDKSAIRDTMDQAKRVKDILDDHFSRVEINSTKHDKTLFTRRTHFFDKERLDTRNQHKDVQKLYDDHYTKLTDGFSTFTTNKEQVYTAHNTKVGKMIQTASDSQFTTYDDGWHKINKSTTKWIDKIHKQIANLDKTIGLTGGPKVGAHKPPHKAHGGMIKGGHVGKGHLIRVGEEGFDEVVIPLAPHRKDRAESLIKQTKARIGSFAAGGFTGLAGVPTDIRRRGPVGKLTYTQLQADRAKWNSELSAKIRAANAAAGGHIGGTGHDAALMRSISKQLGWNFQDWWNLDAQETGHGTNLVNPSSTARLRGQFLSMNYGKYGIGSDPSRRPSMDEQIRSMALYIKSRYGNATNAWRHEQAYNWYAAGGIVGGTGTGQGTGQAGGIGTTKLPHAITNIGHGTYYPTTPQDKKDYKSFLTLLHKLEKTLPPAQSNSLRAAESRFGPKSLFGAIHEMFEGSRDSLTEILKKIAKDIKLQKRIALAEVSASVRQHIGPKGRVGTISRTDYFTRQTRHLGAGKFGGQGAQTILDNEIALANQVGLPKLFKQVAADQLNLDTLIGGVTKPNPKKGKPPIVVHGTHAQLRAARALLRRDFSSFKRIRDRWLKEGLAKGVNLTIMQEALAHAQDVSTPTSDQDVSAYLGDNLSVIHGSGKSRGGNGSGTKTGTGFGQGSGFAHSRIQLASGLARVPKDNFPANLHKDEAVLNAPQASQWRKQQASTEPSAQEKTQKKILNTLVESKDLFQKSEYRKIADQIRGKGGGTGPGAATGGAVRMDLVKPKVVIDQTGSNAIKIDQKPTINELVKQGNFLEAANEGTKALKKQLKDLTLVQADTKQDIRALEAAAKDTSLTDKQHVAVTNALHATQKAAKLDNLAHAATTKAMKELTDAANLQRTAVKESVDADTAATKAQKDLVLANNQLTAAMAETVTDAASDTRKQTDTVAAQKAILQANNDIAAANSLTAKAQLDTQNANNAVTKAVKDATEATKLTQDAALATQKAHQEDVNVLHGTAEAHLLSTNNSTNPLLNDIKSGGFLDANPVVVKQLKQLQMLDNVYNRTAATADKLDDVHTAIHDNLAPDGPVATKIIGVHDAIHDNLEGKGPVGTRLDNIIGNTGAVRAFYTGKTGIMAKMDEQTGKLFDIHDRLNKVVSAIHKIKGWGKAGGFYRVPYDEYPATLHQDEMVLTAAEANVYRGKPDHNTNSGSGNTSTMEDLLRSINEQLMHQRPPTVNVVNTHKAIQSQIQPQSSYTRTK